MKHNTRKRKYHWWWLLLLPAVACCNNKQRRLASLMADAENGLMQVKNTGHQTIAMEILPPAALLRADKSSTKDFYRVKLLLRSNEKIRGKAAMQYINFGIKNSFFAVQGADTLPCIVCERIPGINDRDYIYIALFSKPAVNRPGANLRLFVTDTTAGFGTTVFAVKNDALKKLAATAQ